MKTFKRDSTLANVLTKTNISFSGSAKVIKKSRKRGYCNILLKDIKFEAFNDIQCIDHVWLQERDIVPKEMYELVGKEIKITFSFYKYRDAIDRNMCGITVTHISK